VIRTIFPVVPGLLRRGSPVILTSGIRGLVRWGVNNGESYEVTLDTQAAVACAPDALRLVMDDPAGVTHLREWLAETCGLNVKQGVVWHRGEHVDFLCCWMLTAAGDGSSDGTFTIAFLDAVEWGTPDVPGKLDEDYVHVPGVDAITDPVDALALCAEAVARAAGLWPCSSVENTP
jgi:hypothetical protein